MHWLAVQMEHQQGLTVEVQTEGTIRQVKEDLRVLLFQIVRELLFNVVKHAGVNHAMVKLTFGDEQLWIEVSDKGVGFVPKAAQGGRQMSQGLTRMEQRLQFLGGGMEIASALGQGTHITLNVPLQGHEQGA